MARHFESNARLENTSQSPVTVAPVTLACWVKVASLTEINLFRLLHPSSSSDEFAIKLFGSGVVKGLVRESSSEDNVSTVGTLSTGVWSFCAMTHDGSNIAVQLNSEYVTAASTKVPSGIGRTRIHGDSGSAFDYAEVAVWSAALSQAELLSLYNAGPVAISPLFAQRESIEAYWKLLEDDGDVNYIGGVDLTEVNTPTYSQHPATIYPSEIIYSASGGGKPEPVPGAAFFHAEMVLPPVQPQHTPLFIGNLDQLPASGVDVFPSVRVTQVIPGKKIQYKAYTTPPFIPGAPSGTGAEWRPKVDAPQREQLRLTEGWYTRPENFVDLEIPLALTMALDTLFREEGTREQHAGSFIVEPSLYEDFDAELFTYRPNPTEPLLRPVLGGSVQPVDHEESIHESVPLVQPAPQFRNEQRAQPSYPVSVTELPGDGRQDGWVIVVPQPAPLVKYLHPDSSVTPPNPDAHGMLPDVEAPVHIPPESPVAYGAQTFEPAPIHDFSFIQNRTLQYITMPDPVITRRDPVIVEVPDLDEWYRPISEPVRRALSIGASEHRFFSEVVIAELVLVSGIIVSVKRRDTVKQVREENE